MTNDKAWLAGQFERHRSHLRGVAYRMLGSQAEAEDAVQEAWLRLHRSDLEAVENLGGWLTTVLARICLDTLRSRRSRGEQPPDAATHPGEDRGEAPDPQQEAQLADSVGLALLVVLESLAPAERVAFVLHDMFDLPFDEIAPIVGKSPAAVRQLASRARRRVRGRRAARADLVSQRKIVEAFLAAMRAGDFAALLRVLDPDLVVRVDQPMPGAPAEVRGARNWGKQAMAFSQALRSSDPALVNGAAGLVWAPRGVLVRALKFTIVEGRIARIDVVAAPEAVRRLDIAVLGGS